MAPSSFFLAENIRETGVEEREDHLEIPRLLIGHQVRQSCSKQPQNKEQLTIGEQAVAALKVAIHLLGNVPSGTLQAPNQFGGSHFFIQPQLFELRPKDVLFFGFLATWANSSCHARFYTGMKFQNVSY